MRKGFTLVEMLVVLVIVVTLVAIVAGSLIPSNADRVRTAARVLQSKINLAKNSAASDRMVRGIRLERSASDPRIAVSLSMIGSSGTTDGTLSDVSQFVGSPSTVADNYWRVSCSVPGLFNRLSQRGILAVGSHIQIPAGSGQWFTITDKEFNPAGNVLSLAGHLSESRWNGVDGYEAVYQRGPPTASNPLGDMSVPYRLELQPSVMAEGAPAALPSGTAIEIDASQVPDSWRAPNANWDILFDSQGNTVSGTGLIHLYVTRMQDIELTRGMFGDHPANGGARTPPIVPGNPPNVPTTEPFVVTVLKMGNSYASPVNQADGNADLQADNPFNYARQGREQ